jgi:DNA-binding transcriptional regulator YiaG
VTKTATFRHAVGRKPDFGTKMHKSVQSPPTNALFGDLMAECGFTVETLSSRIGVHRNTVSKWANGKTKPPGAAVAFLETLAAVKRIAG